MIIRLEWEETVEEWVDEPILPTILPWSPRVRTFSTASRSGTAPSTSSTLGQSAQMSYQQTTSGLIRQPLRSAPSTNGVVSQAMLRSKPHGEPSPVNPRLTKSIASTVTSPSPSTPTTPRKAPSRRTFRPPASLPDSAVPEEWPGERKTRAIPLFARPPTVKEILDVPDIERGAVDARRSRIVSSTRFAARAGADRQVGPGGQFVVRRSGSSCISRHRFKRVRRLW